MCAVPALFEAGRKNLGSDVHLLHDVHHRLTSITMASALHFDLSVPNFGIQEHMEHAEVTESAFPTPTAATTAIFIPVRRRAMARTLTKRKPPSTPTNAPIFRSTDWKTVRCTIGEQSRFRLRDARRSVIGVAKQNTSG